MSEVPKERIIKFVIVHNPTLDEKYNFGGYIFKTSTEDFILNNGNSLVSMFLSNMYKWKSKNPKVYRAMKV